MRANRELLDLARAIVVHLGGDWRAEVREDDVLLYRTDGRGVTLQWSWPPTDQLTICGSYATLWERARELGTHLDYHDVPPRVIHVSVGRGPAVVAKEIARRLLPPYEATFASCQQRLVAAAKAMARREAATRQLAAELPAATIASDGRRLQWYGCGSGDFVPDAAGTTVTVHLRSLPVEVAGAVARLLAVATQDREP